MSNETDKGISNIYHKARKESNYTRDAATYKMDSISPERLERIENDKINVTPRDVIEMAKAYEKPELCNYYCANQCDIGKRYMPEVKIDHLSQIVLDMLNSLNTIEEKKNRLIAITADGEISDNELLDFASIQEELSHISLTVQALRLWTEKMIANGTIDQKKLEEIKLKLNKNK